MGLSLIISACQPTSSGPVATPNVTQTDAPTVVVAKATQLPPAKQPAFKHVFIIQLENEGAAQVIKDPYFADLAQRGRLLSNYSAVAHPSQPNYIAQIAGDTFVFDDASHNLKQTNLVDLLEKANVSWKAYLENYPGHCYAKSTADGRLYARKHNPFISFDNIRNNSKRCANIVNSDQLTLDLAAGHLPQVAFYTPNQNNDGHDTGLAYASNWLKTFLEPKLADRSFMDQALVIVTFDESNSVLDNHVFTVLLGSSVAIGTDAHPYTHYDLLRTLEDNFGLGTLQRKDATAHGFQLTIKSVDSTTTSEG